MSVFRGANPFDQLTPGVKYLLITNGVVFIIQLAFPELIRALFALSPSQVIDNFWLWQLVTYSFLHGSGWHLFINMFVLWMFSPHVEAYWGTKIFLRFYFICVLGAGLTQCIMTPTSDVYVVGASGGIYGLLLAFGFLFPDSIIYMFFIFPLKAIQAVLVIAAITFASSIHSSGSGIAHFAHLGGLITGFLYFKVPQWSYKLKFWRQSWNLQHPRGNKRKSSTHSPVNIELELSQQVDRILEKISQSGIDSLTPEEHETMRRYSEKKGR